MKREDVRAHIEGITDEQLDWLMSEHGKEIESYKSFKTELSNVRKELSDTKAKLTQTETDLTSANEKLGAFEGVDVTALRTENDDLKNQIEAVKKKSAFDRKLDGAILTANGRNVTACRSLLGEETIKALSESENLDEDIKSAIEACVTANPWAFKDSNTDKMTVNLGGDTSGGNKIEEIDGVTRRFMEMNPDLAKKI